MLFHAALSADNYRDMGQGMGQQISRELTSNFLEQKTKEKIRNHSGFGSFMAKVHEVDTILQKTAMQQQFCGCIVPLIAFVLFR